MVNGLRRRSAVLATTIGLLALSRLALLDVSAENATATSDETVARFLNSGRPALTEYRATRHLEAAAKGGSLNAQLDALTELAADGTFTFQIIQEAGSDLIRGRVLRAALLAEQRGRSADQLAAAALSPANYDFSVEETDLDGDLVKIALSPRRNSRMLIAGTAFVTRDAADLVRIEGILSKGPSFWTRKVHVTRRYARVDGVRVPVEVQSRADVRLVGHSSFSMTYQYTAINGRPLRAE
jgi:hypothetical protein